VCVCEGGRLPELVTRSNPLTFLLLAEAWVLVDTDELVCSMAKVLVSVQRFDEGIRVCVIGRMGSFPRR
jgi:hypothetical protein